MMLRWQPCGCFCNSSNAFAVFALNDSSKSIVVAALYRFVPLNDFSSLKQPLEQLMDQVGVRGSLLLASEGINGTIAGSQDGIHDVIEFIRSDERLNELEVKYSYCDEMPFRRGRVRLKKEIVTMGVEGIDPNASVGTYVNPEDWNELISDPDVLVIDTRNDYEVAIGTFQGAVNPDTHSFREFPDFVDQELDAKQHTKIAMFCTGGIRCEKSTSLLKQKGFTEVFHLRGGILKYLETVPEEDSLWEGECFVFDHRVAVGHGLEESDHVMCFACGWPVDAEQQKDPAYQYGVHCPKCIDQLSAEQIARFTERQRQMSIQKSSKAVDSQQSQI